MLGSFTTATVIEPIEVIDEMNSRSLQKMRRNSRALLRLMWKQKKFAPHERKKLRELTRLVERQIERAESGSISIVD